jgi:hypothetical protein
MPKTISEETVRSYFQMSGYNIIQYNGIGVDTKHLTEHLLCGHKFPTSYQRFKNCGQRCQKCAKRLKITEEQIKEFLEEDGYKLVAYNGIGSHTNHSVKHLLCGHIYPVCYNTFKNGGNRCPKCAKKAKITEEEIRECLEEEGYRLIQYNGIGHQTKHTVEHILCGCQYPTNYDRFKNGGQRCPDCSKSRTENECRKVFESLFPEHKFPNTRPNFLQGLELDGYCEELNMAFEYNGRQHYEVVDFIQNDTQEDLEERQEHDRRKLEICNQRGIKLCVIPSTYNCYEPKKLETFIKIWVSSVLAVSN